MRNLWLPLLLGVLLTAVLFYFGIIFSKSGDKTFSFIFFPYTSLLDLIPHKGSDGLGLALGYASFFLQYPLYAIILGVALNRGRFYNWLLALLGLHVLLSIVCFVTNRH
ncbi:MAG TPA: hypothetical protein VF553_02525 [Pyrinomonadaceae bacterium]|jgi:hypothetical protein